MIILKNSQRKIKLDLDRIKSEIQVVLNALKYSDYDVSIWITTNKTIKLYNKQYRYKDYATDVLSFPYHDTLQAGERIKPIFDEDKNLGDMIISLERVLLDAVKFKVTLEERLRLIIVHGICHLLGYDHIIDSDFRKMRIKEAYLLKQINQGK